MSRRMLSQKGLERLRSRIYIRAGEIGTEFEQQSADLTDDASREIDGMYDYYLLIEQRFERYLDIITMSELDDYLKWCSDLVLSYVMESPVWNHGGYEL